VWTLTVCLSHATSPLPPYSTSVDLTFLPGAEALGEAERKRLDEHLRIMSERGLCRLKVVSLVGSGGELGAFDPLPRSQRAKHLSDILGDRGLQHLSYFPGGDTTRPPLAPNVVRIVFTGYHFDDGKNCKLRVQ